MRRRQWLRYCVSLSASAATLAGLSAMAHTPYGQWQVYRKKHLLIGCHREDLVTWELARQMVTTLEQHLPAAKARVARAPHPQRLASLLGTDQLHFAVVNKTEAADMIAGNGRFKPYGPLPLQVLWQNDGYLLLARSDVPIRHGWLVSAALDDADASLTPPQSSDSADVLSSQFSWHEGAILYQSGQPPPQ